MERCSILIPAYNAEKTIKEALDSCVMQDYPCLEIIVSDNRSADETPMIAARYPQVILKWQIENIGGINNMNDLLTLATGDYIIMLCADDYFTNKHVLSDIVKTFQKYPKVGYIGRYYYQFLDGNKKPIRGFRSNNPYRSADNWSGLAFRRSCMPLKLSHNIFVEAVNMVKDVQNKGWDVHVLKYDTIAVRTTFKDNGSQNAFCYINSPIKNWIDLIGKEHSVLTNFVSLIQIKNWGTYKALLREIWYFIKYKPSNLFRLDFWIFSSVSLITPKFILKFLVNFYKIHIGKIFTKEIKR